MWHLGAALERQDKKAEALSYYIKSYNAGEPDPVRRTVIEQLYRKVNGSLDGLDERIGPATGRLRMCSQHRSVVKTPDPLAQPTSSPESAPTATPELLPPVAEASPSPAVTLRRLPAHAGHKIGTNTIAGSKLPSSEPTPSPSPTSLTESPLERRS